MVIVLKSITPSNYFEEEVGAILQQNWKENANFRTGLLKYFQTYP
jgi:hypothetical protein